MKLKTKFLSFIFFEVLKEKYVLLIYKNRKNEMMLENWPYLHYLLGAFVGVGLAAASGFRVFLPMFVVSLASYLGWIPIGENFSWLTGLPTVIATGIATVVEIFAYYIPYVDHLLDSLSVPMATVAGAVLFASQFTGLDAFPLWALALIAGGGTAATISSGFAGARAVSTATTGGLGNSVVATSETAGAGLMSALALALPIIAVVVSVVLVLTVLVYGRKLWRKLSSSKT